MISISTKLHPSTLPLLSFVRILVYHSLGFPRLRQLSKTIRLRAYARTYFLSALHQLPNRETRNTDKTAERLGRLKPEEKVAIAIDMTDTCIRICADGIKAQNPGISEEELIEKLRERLEWTKRNRKRLRF